MVSHQRVNRANSENYNTNHHKSQKGNFPLFRQGSFSFKVRIIKHDGNINSQNRKQKCTDKRKKVDEIRNKIANKETKYYNNYSHSKFG